MSLNPAVKLEAVLAPSLPRIFADDGQLPLVIMRMPVRRYITLPAQATGYKIGMLKIMELRQRAE